MKKLVLVAAVAVVALSSCKKDYVCQCTSGSITAKGSTVYHDTKKNADKNCTSTVSGITCEAVAK